jgi:hypothetical protein
VIIWPIGRFWVFGFFYLWDQKCSDFGPSGRMNLVDPSFRQIHLVRMCIFSKLTNRLFIFFSKDRWPNGTFKRYWCDTHLFLDAITSSVRNKYKHSTHHSPSRHQHPPLLVPKKEHGRFYWCRLILLVRKKWRWGRAWVFAGILSYLTHENWSLFSISPEMLSYLKFSFTLHNLFIPCNSKPIIHASGLKNTRWN